MMLVEEIMKRDVVTVGPDLSVRELAKLLTREGISGAPVVDGSRRILGVVSATDVLALVANDAEVSVDDRAQLESVRRSPEGSEAEPVYGYYADLYEPDLPLDSEATTPGTSSLDVLTVADIMTPAHFSIRPDSTVRELADFLSKGRIHRALVEVGGGLVGIVTTFDVLEAVAEHL